MGEACSDTQQFMGGLDDLKGLFQANQFYDCRMSHFILLRILFCL